MTMEDRSGGIDRAAPATSNTSTISNQTIRTDASYPLQRTNKRTFDVAFLVAPDENLARRQNEKLRLVSTDRLCQLNNKKVPEITAHPSTDDLDNKLPQNLTIKHSNYESTERNLKLLHCTSENSLSPPYVSPRTLTPTLARLSPEPEPALISRTYDPVRLQKSPSPQVFGSPVLSPDNLIPGSDSRSAFTKVSLIGQPRNGFDEGQTSPRSSISPDDRASYQSSVSPPVVTLPSTYKYTPTFPTKMSYPFLVTPEASQSSNCLLDNLKIPQPSKAPSPKITTSVTSATSASFRPEIPAIYPNLPYNPITVFPPMAEALTRPRFLATAAGVAGLLPPSFAALALPAQNVCAKCNLSFRMTSDLVYHMRSHHKNEHSGEAARRRREEKLRCPVCDESFRERHHLTRHMTAHQDKESDAIVDQVDIKRRPTTVHGK